MPGRLTLAHAFRTGQANLPIQVHGENAPPSHRRKGPKWPTFTPPAARPSRRFRGQSFAPPLTPAHRNTRTPALSLADGGDGRLLALCHAGCGFPAVLDALRGLGLVSGTGRYVPPDASELARLREAREAEAAKREAQALALAGAQAQPIGGTLAERLPSRARHRLSPSRDAALPCTRAGTRPRSGCPRWWRWWKGPNASRCIGPISPSSGRKTELEPAKAMLGAVAGGAVRLAEADGPLVVAEGIETALSLASGLLRAPATVWAALSASGMAGLRLPEPAGPADGRDRWGRSRPGGRPRARRARARAGLGRLASARPRWAGLERCARHERGRGMMPEPIPFKAGRAAAALAGSPEGRTLSRRGAGAARRGRGSGAGQDPGPRRHPRRVGAGRRLARGAGAR